MFSAGWLRWLAGWRGKIGRLTSRVLFWPLIMKRCVVVLKWVENPRTFLMKHNWSFTLVFPGRHAAPAAMVGYVNVVRTAQTCKLIINFHTCLVNGGNGGCRSWLWEYKRNLKFCQVYYFSLRKTVSFSVNNCVCYLPNLHLLFSSKGWRWSTNSLECFLFNNACKHVSVWGSVNPVNSK